MNGLRVSADEVKRALDQGETVIMVDVRAPDAWAAASRQAAGAVRLPLSDFEAHAGDLPRLGEIVAYCT